MQRAGQGITAKRAQKSPETGYRDEQGFSYNGSSWLLGDAVVLGPRLSLLCTQCSPGDGGNSLTIGVRKRGEGNTAGLAVCGAEK